MGGNYSAPLGISISPFLVLDSGTPFNITVGQDLNGDNQFILSDLMCSAPVLQSLMCNSIQPGDRGRRARSKIEPVEALDVIGRKAADAMIGPPACRIRADSARF